MECSCAIFIIIFGWFFIGLMAVCVPCWMSIEAYEIRNGENIIWVSKNRDISWLVTNFLPFFAIPYERLCERINGDGLVIILGLILLAMLPNVIILTIIGLIVLLIKKTWRAFCTSFARKGDIE